jgi:hypothetical protein
MNVQKIVGIAIGVIAIGIVLTACKRRESTPASSLPEISLQDVTNIVFSESVRENGERKQYEFAVNDADEVRRLVSFKKLEPSRFGDLCMHIYAVKFQKRSGQPITLSFCPATFETLADFGLRSTNPAVYVMPEGFYAEFQRLGPQGFGSGHWHPEQAP